MNAPAQYGPEITTRVADVVVGHHVPVKRSTILVMELLGMQVSTGFAAGLRARATGKTTYLNVACTEHLALMHTGDRSAATIDAGRVLGEQGAGQVLVRDGYAGYTHLTNVLHAWCGAHLLRGLRGIHEGDPAGQLWAKAMADTLFENELRCIDRLYTGALTRARIDSSASDRSVLAGHARTLAARFETHQKVILRFTTDLAVGSTNYAAERQVRAREGTATIVRRLLANTAGLADFAVVKSYLSTAAPGASPLSKPSTASSTATDPGSPPTSPRQRSPPNHKDQQVPEQLRDDGWSQGGEQPEQPGQRLGVDRDYRSEPGLLCADA